jgi:hypothetical protein
MIGQEISRSEVPLNVDILLWDALEQEWRIGHQRRVLDGVEPFFCACCKQDADDMIDADQPVPIFERVTHWVPLPPKIGGEG